MSTHINAFKEELRVAEIELGRAQARVDHLKDYIASQEPETPVEEASVETDQVPEGENVQVEEPFEPEEVKVKVKKSKK